MPTKASKKSKPARSKKLKDLKLTKKAAKVKGGLKLQPHGD